MTMLQRLLSMMALLALTACGGGGDDAGTSPFGGGNGGNGGTGSAVADLDVQLSSATIPNSGTGAVTATVTALDANRNAIKDVKVTLSANNDAVLTVAGGGVTDANGKVLATVGTGSNVSNRVITITATSGSISKTADLTVVTASPSTPTAADISLALSSPSIANSGTATVVATVTAVDANRNTVAGIPVSFRVNNDASIQTSSATTDAAGVATGTVRIGANRANRTIVVTAVSGALTREASLQVVGTKVTSTALPTVLTPSQTGRVQYRVVDFNGNPMPDVDITITGAGGVTSTAKTGLNGDYEYSFTAPTTSGVVDIRASAGGVENVTTVIVQSSGPSTVPPVPAGSVRSASVRANPSVVPVNTGEVTTNRTEVRALFVGDNNAPIKNVRVRFDLNGDANSIGGTFNTGDTLVYSDSSGVALSAYIPGARFSPTDGVTVRACWDYTDFAAGTCPNQATSTLTVIADPLSVTIGTDELIVLEDLVYVKRFVIQVNDSSGLAKPDVQVSPLLDLPAYRKGYYTQVQDGLTKVWVQTVTASNCENEDINRNGVLEVYSNGGVEDANDNLQLDPRKADVNVAFEGSSRTDGSGQVKVRLIYPRNVASWVRFNLTVAAAGVAGTEGRASFASWLPVVVDALKADASPAFQRSPYGIDASPSIIVNSPDGASASLCTNPN